MEKHKVNIAIMTINDNDDNMMQTSVCGSF